MRRYVSQGQSCVAVAAALGPGDRPSQLPVSRSRYQKMRVVLVLMMGRPRGEIQKMGWDACPWDGMIDDDDDDISSLPLARVVIPHEERLVYISVCAPLNCLSTHEKNEGA